MNVFMPDNERRRAWKAQVESLNPVTLEPTSSVHGEDLSEKTQAEYLKSRDLVEEASAAYHHPQVLQALLAFKASVGLELENRTHIS